MTSHETRALESHFAKDAVVHPKVNLANPQAQAIFNKQHNIPQSQKASGPKIINKIGGRKINPATGQVFTPTMPVLTTPAPKSKTTVQHSTTSVAPKTSTAGVAPKAPKVLGPGSPKAHAHGGGAEHPTAYLAGHAVGTGIRKVASTGKEAVSGVLAGLTKDSRNKDCDEDVVITRNIAGKEVLGHKVAGRWQKLSEDSIVDMSKDEWSEAARKAAAEKRKQSAKSNYVTRSQHETGSLDPRQFRKDLNRRVAARAKTGKDSIVDMSTDEWSEAARKAALAARKGKSSGGKRYDVPSSGERKAREEESSANHVDREIAREAREEAHRRRREEQTNYS